MTLPAHKRGCDCALGFFFSGNKCLSFIEFGPQPTHTFPNCQEPNMVRNSSGYCNCKIGFQKNSKGECENIC